MNDFTKDELEGLLESVISSNWIFEEKRKELESKIKYLIDNYCEHDDGTHTWEGFFCYKCGKAV